MHSIDLLRCCTQSLHPIVNFKYIHKCTRTVHTYTYTCHTRQCQCLCSPPTVYACSQPSAEAVSWARSSSDLFIHSHKWPHVTKCTPQPLHISVQHTSILHPSVLHTHTHAHTCTDTHTHAHTHTRTHTRTHTHTHTHTHTRTHTRTHM